MARTYCSGCPCLFFVEEADFACCGLDYTVDEKISLSTGTEYTSDNCDLVKITTKNGQGDWTPIRDTEEKS